MLGLAVLGGCRHAPPPVGAAAAAAAPYPSLDTVPPRPPPELTPEQRAEVENGLVRDRDHVAYLADLLDFETGRTTVPPPPEPAAAPGPPPAAAAPPEPERPHGPGDDPAVEAYVKDAMARDEDEGKLKDFMRKLERPVPGAEAPASLAAELGRAPTPALDAAAGDGPPRSPALQHFGSYLGGVLGVDGASAATMTAHVAPEGEVLARLAFADGSAALPDGADAALGQALERARTAGAGLRIAGGGPEGSAPVDRTRSVALALLRLGATPEMLALDPGGPGSEVRVTLAMPPHA